MPNVREWRTIGKENLITNRATKFWFSHDCPHVQPYVLPYARANLQEVLSIKPEPLVGPAGLTEENGENFSHQNTPAERNGSHHCLFLCRIPFIIVKIIISSIAIDYKKLVQSCYMTVCYWTVCYRTVQ